MALNESLRIGGPVMPDLPISFRRFCRDLRLSDAFTALTLD
jgi:hypothetical protein